MTKFFLKEMTMFVLCLMPWAERSLKKTKKEQRNLDGSTEVSGFDFCCGVLSIVRSELPLGFPESS